MLSPGRSARQVESTSPSRETATATLSKTVPSITLWHHIARTDERPRTGSRGARCRGRHGVQVTNSASSWMRAFVGVSNTARSTTNSTRQLPVVDDDLADQHHSADDAVAVGRPVQAETVRA